jgi:AbrB family looped-hinge helix DNA binding protein
MVRSGEPPTGKEKLIMHSTVTKKGQTTIPAKIRAALRIKPGDQLEYVLGKDYATIRVHPGIGSLPVRSCAQTILCATLLVLAFFSLSDGVFGEIFPL